MTRQVTRQPGHTSSSSTDTHECLFCRIIRHALPAEIVEEANGLIAVRDINPQAPTHLLIIPTQHIRSLADVTESEGDLMAKLILFANQLARQAHLTESGYRLVINCGEQAGQSVWHLHVHLLGGRALRWPPG